MEHIDLKDFDIMGIFTLKEVAGIEKYVTEVSGNEYLSRSKEYYLQKNFTELSNDRDTLNSILTEEVSRRNFVILENMLNASAKVYYASLKDHILHGETKIYNQAKICFEEDVQNIVNILSGNKTKKSTQKLPRGETKTPDRAIELDNKAVLYLFCDTIEIPKDKHILTPGYGSLYLGQFLHCIKGNMYSNLLKSSYIQDEEEKNLLATKSDIFELVSNSDALKHSKDVILLDDNVGTGQTIQDIKKQLQQKGIHTSCGAVQFNWINRFRYFQGEKETTFNIKDFEYMTPFNYPGHKLMEHAIASLMVSGDSYINYLKSKSYRSNIINDLVGSIARSELYTKNLNFNLYSDKSYSITAKKTNIDMKEAVFNISGKTWFEKHKIKRGIKAFKKYFLSTIPPFEEVNVSDNVVDYSINKNLNRLAKLRKKLAKDIDKSLGTNIEKIKLPQQIKYIEKSISQKFFDR